MKVLVLGAGVSGRAAVRLAIRLGDEVAVYDANPRQLVGPADDGLEVLGGDWSDSYLEGRDLVVTSPGIPEHATPIAASLASGVTLWSELEFGSRHVAAPLVAVTGTNGKSTVTSLVAEMAAAHGSRSIAAGNIGTPLSDQAGKEWDLVAVEASSFQLRFIESLSPQVAVVLNVVPDHLDWHGSVAAYAAAKARILENQSADDVVVYDADDPGAAELVEGATSTRVAVSGSRRLAGGGMEDGKLWAGDVPVADVPGIDPAFGLDLAAAAAAASAAGVDVAAIGDAISRFEPGPHRRTRVAAAGGVEWVDDSKATNPHAALASVAAFSSVVLIAGGRNKGLDLAPLTEAPTVEAIVAIGEAAPELVRAGGDKVTTAGDMAEAVRTAGELAAPGDTVLLAPGCASFDMFESYAARGEAFVAAVAEVVGEMSQ